MSKKEDGNKLLFFFLMGILILIPIFFYMIAHKASSNTNNISNEGIESNPEESEQTVVPAGDYFKDIFSRDFSKNSEELQYFRDDPFKSVCGKSGSEENPSVSSNTVCMY